MDTRVDKSKRPRDEEAAVQQSSDQDEKDSDLHEATMGNVDDHSGQRSKTDTDALSVAEDADGHGDANTEIEPQVVLKDGCTQETCMVVPRKAGGTFLIDGFD